MIGGLGMGTCLTLTLTLTLIGVGMDTGVPRWIMVISTILGQGTMDLGSAEKSKRHIKIQPTMSIIRLIKCSIIHIISNGLVVMRRSRGPLLTGRDPNMTQEHHPLLTLGVHGKMRLEARRGPHPGSAMRFTPSERVMKAVPLGKGRVGL